MSRMESILHPIFCLFLYFKLVATFDGNFSSNGIWHFLLCQAFSFLFLGWGSSLTRNKLYVFHDGGIYIASQEQLWVFWSLVKVKGFQNLFQQHKYKGSFLRSIWKLVRDLHNVWKFTQKVSFNIASEASYVFISSGQKLYQTGHF